MNREIKNIIFSISGGVGKNIMATAVINSLREQYPNSNITVATPYKLVWDNNPDINAVVNFVDDESFYKNYVKNKDVLFLGHDPYLHKNFIYKQENLIETWCKLFDIKYNGSLPKMYFAKEEKEGVREKLPKDKKLFFIQTSGGYNNQNVPISWTRDLPLPIAQKVVDHMKDKGYEAIHIRRKDQYSLENTLWLDLSLREFLCALNFADKLLLIDSVAQHAAIAVDKKAVVCWVGNTPKVFGYDKHTNIVSATPKEFRHQINSYLDQYNITGDITECPYDTNELFDVDEIIKALEA